MEEYLTGIFPKHSKDKIKVLFEYLNQIGVVGIEDLKIIKRNYLNDLKGFSEFELRKLLGTISKDFSNEENDNLSKVNIELESLQLDIETKKYETAKMFHEQMEIKTENIKFKHYSDVVKNEWSYMAKDHDAKLNKLQTKRIRRRNLNDKIMTSRREIMQVLADMDKLKLEDPKYPSKVKIDYEKHIESQSTFWAYIKSWFVSPPKFDYDETKRSEYNKFKSLFDSLESKLKMYEKELEKIDEEEANIERNCGEVFKQLKSNNMKEILY